MADRRLASILVLAIAIFAMIMPSIAFAHGEAGDEPFLKDLTTAFYDVKISPSEIHVGEPVTITGKVRILDTWPYTLDEPKTAYITPVVPGPVFATSLPLDSNRSPWRSHKCSQRIRRRPPVTLARFRFWFSRSLEYPQEHCSPLGPRCLHWSRFAMTGLTSTRQLQALKEKSGPALPDCSFAGPSLFRYCSSRYSHPLPKFGSQLTGRVLNGKLIRRIFCDRFAI